MTPPALPCLADVILEDRLNILAIVTTVSGAVKALMISILLIHFLIFGVISFLPEGAFQNDPPSEQTHEITEENPLADSPSKNAHPPKGMPGEVRIIFRVITVIIGLIILLGWILGGLIIYSGHCLRRRKNPNFILVMAAIQCLFLPYGTMIGIFTFIVLGHPRAKTLFHSVRASQ